MSDEGSLGKQPRQSCGCRLAQLWGWKKMLAQAAAADRHLRRSQRNAGDGVTFLCARQLASMLIGETACIVTAQLHSVSPREFQNYIIAKGEHLKIQKLYSCRILKDTQRICRTMLQQ